MIKDLVKSALTDMGVMNNPPPEREPSKGSLPETMESSEEEASQQGEPFLDQLLLSAEEQLDFDCFASPPSFRTIQHSKVQTPIRARSQVNPQMTPLAQPQRAQPQAHTKAQPTRQQAQPQVIQVPQAQPQVTQAQPAAPRQPPFSPCRQPQAQVVPPPVRRLVQDPIEEDKYDLSCLIEWLNFVSLREQEPRVLLRL